MFNESVPAACSYAELCLRINEKLGQTTSIKYLAPGEEVNPDELVCISGEDDLRVRKEESPVQSMLPPRDACLNCLLFKVESWASTSKTER